MFPLIISDGSFQASSQFPHMRMPVDTQLNTGGSYFGNFQGSFCVTFSSVLCPANLSCLCLPRLSVPSLQSWESATLCLGSHSQSCGLETVNAACHSNLLQLTSLVSCFLVIVVLCCLMYSVLQTIVSFILSIFFPHAGESTWSLLPYCDWQWKTYYHLFFIVNNFKQKVYDYNNDGILFKIYSQLFLL